MNLTKNGAKSIFLCAVVFSVAGFSSCSSSRKEETVKQVASFNQSVIKGVDATKDYYNSVNDRQAALYQQILILFPDCKVGVGKDNSNNCEFLRDSSLSLDSFLPIAEINKRLDLLKSLSEYSQALAELSTDQSPEKAKASIVKSSKSFKGIEQGFRKLSPSSGESSDENSLNEKYVGPISNIISTLAEFFIDEKRWDAVSDFVIANEKNVATLLDFVEADINKIAIFDIQDTAQFRLSMLINYYNNNQSKMTEKQRAKMIAEMSAIRRTMQLDIDLTTTASNIKEVHEDLVKAAKSNGTSYTLKELKNSLEEASNEIDEFVKSIKRLTADEAS